MTAAVREHGSRLSEVDGIGPVIAARLLGRTRQPSRFRSASAFACYAGIAPVEVASADRARHRLPRGGDRQLNCALHQVAITQIRGAFVNGELARELRLKVPNDLRRNRVPDCCSG